MATYNRVMIIAGSDSGGGAGLQADLKTATVLGSFATTVITTITAQNTQGVQAQKNVEENVVEAQFRSIMDDIGTDGIKIGLLPTAKIIEVVERLIKDHAPVVIDPVMVATSGHRFLDKDAEKAMTRMASTTGSLITPNIAEAEIFADKKIDPQCFRDVELLLHTIATQCNRPVLLKGGHGGGDLSIDYLIDWSGKIHSFAGERISTKNTHGTGCTLATAIAVNLARGISLVDSIGKAKAFVSAALRSGVDTTVGQGSGPVDHMWQTVHRHMSQSAPTT